MAKRLFAMLECQSSLENPSPFFVDTKRTKRYSSDTDIIASSSSPSNAVIGFPRLPEEPNSSDFCDRSVLCRICVRLPDGKKVQRSFMRSDSVQLLWSFCYSQIEEKKKRFKLIQAFPGEYKTLHYGSNTTFQESGLANSLISVTWA
ncbi:unnamed protein product [Cochlearia groenlandica]